MELTAPTGSMPDFMPSRSLEEVRAILLDVAGTLYSSPEFDALIEDQANIALATSRGCSVDDAKDLLRSQRAENKERFGDPTKVRALEDLGVPREAFQDAAAELDPSSFLVDAPPVGPVLLALRSRGIKVGVLSNFREILVRKVFSCLDIDWDQIDASVCVEDGLPIKPDPAPFLALCERLGVVPGQAMFVGDSLSKDLTPAKRLGMTTVWIETSESDGDPSVVDYRAASIDALLDLLSS
jgi:putative hydrolase of the HAD superfamily